MIVGISLQTPQVQRYKEHHEQLHAHYLMT